MGWSEKIDNKRYLAGCLLAVVYALYFGRNGFLDSMLLLGMILASGLSQWIMFKILGKFLSNMTQSRSASDRFSQLVLWGQVLLKFSVIGVMLFILITWGRHLVSHGLILYTFQLIILILSIKNIGAFLKKGSSE